MLPGWSDRKEKGEDMNVLDRRGSFPTFDSGKGENRVGSFKSVAFSPRGICANAYSDNLRV